MSISKKARDIFLAVLMVLSFVACNKSSAEGVNADLVVYGKIFTSEGNQIVEAFAVKDGKYIYVGDKAGAEAFIEAGKTEVVDYTGKGLVMPGCGNGHAHYSMGYGIQSVGTVVDREDSVEKFLTEIVPAAVKKAKDTGATAIFGFGWNGLTFPQNMPTRQQLDAICSDIPIYFADEGGHSGIVNTIALVNAGIMKTDGTVLKKEIRGGEIVMGTDGTPTGYLKEQAGTYVRSFMDNENLFPVDMAKENMAKIQEHLLSEGYTMYLDGYSTYFFNDNFYKAAQQMDKAGDMRFVLGLAYEIDSWMDIDARLAQAGNAKKYASTRVKPNWIKLFMDGVVEAGTGFVDPLYPDGHQGVANWTEEELTDITRKANENGVTMHVHVMGNKGVNRIVNAFINGGKDEMRNTLVHVYKANQSDYKRMADNNIYVTAAMLWHHSQEELREFMIKMLPEGMSDKGYPMRSFFDYGVNVSSHSDFPALSGSPDDPFGIMEIAVTGVLHSENGAPWWPEELVTREQAITALTINVAKQMFIENERGSVKEGKYADFLLVNKDVLTCPVTEIHNAKPEATYFEGQKVFSSKDTQDDVYSYNGFGALESFEEVKAQLRAQYGENKKITDGNYDKSLAVKCVNGTFVGKKTENIIEYKGIPFVGKQPVGELRWKAPVDVVPDDGIYEAYYNGKTPRQVEALGEDASLYVQGEDCLYLNIWKADDTSTEKKPVMVWIHGGAFEMGGTADPVYNAYNLVKENPDVIIASIEYRVGVFGFFHLSHLPDGKDYPDAQNLGLMDQMMGLKWIHENIAAFGGDPDNVTIFGESAGGGSVTLLPLIKGSHKYFKRVIAQSGAPVFTRSTEEAINCTNEVMDILGCKTVADLQKVNVEKLLQVCAVTLGLRVWAERDGNYLPLDPYEAYANGAAKDIDIMQGCHKDEMGYFVVGFGLEGYNAWAADRKAKKMAQLTEEEKALVESFCNDAKDVSPEYSSTTRLFDQIVFIAPLFRVSENQVIAGGKCYTYFFTPESSIPMMRSGHAVELTPVFKYDNKYERAFDETFAKTMRRMWVQFAKTGNPSLSAENSPDGKAHEWPLYDLENKQLMIFDEFDIHPAKESDMKILDWYRTYFLTKYYCI